MVWCALKKNGHKESFETLKTAGGDFNNIQSAVSLSVKVLSRSSQMEKKQTKNPD